MIPATCLFESFHCKYGDYAIGGICVSKHCNSQVKRSISLFRSSEIYFFLAFLVAG